MDYTEYLRVAIEEDTLLTKENLKKAFCYFDKDRSESIEKAELKKWLGTGDIIPEEVVTDLMNEADMNGDGTIDLNEFEALLISKLDLDEPLTA
jgi:Ca2+-binding EF-hand superfamily protein